MVGKLPGMPIRVAVPVPRLEPLTYGLASDESVIPGMRVLVPLGTRVLTGTVVEVDVPAVADMKQVLEVLDEHPTYPADLLQLTRRVAEYYMNSWGEVLAAAIPSGMKPTSVIRIHRERPVSASELDRMQARAPRRAALLQVIDELRGDVTLAYLQKRLRYRGVGDQLDALARDGYIRLSHTVRAQPTARMVRAVAIAEAYRQNQVLLKSTFDLLDRKAPKQSLALAFAWMEHQQGVEHLVLTDLAKRSGVSTAVVDALIDRGILSVSSIEKPHESTATGELSSDSITITPTQDQQNAIDRIDSGIMAGAFDPMFLHGVTGSGKTLVYQRCIQTAIAQSRTALVLVPEISLTPQLSDRFQAVFGDRIAVLHSRLSDVERLQQLQRVARGDVDVVIGARSAVFCAIPRLGLIIVDEEHEPSYKQEDPAPRYHGRDVAIMRAQIIGCPIVLGSATPSLETVHNVTTGRYANMTLPKRADGAVMPRIQLVDMRSARKTRRVEGALSHDALDAIAARLQRGEGTIVFLNRRGYAPEVQCRDCGQTPTCPNCDVSLTYHRVPPSMRCHYCGHSEPLVNACTLCGSIDIEEIGSGTQRIEAELQTGMQHRHGASPRIARVDADTTSRRGSLRSILQSFSNGDLDILIGTQMIAKGLDISRVTLVIVVNADRSLHMSDFRASERTFQLLTQVAGRSGRKHGHPGEVIIQTSSPEHPVLQLIAGGERLDRDVQQWYASELQLRSEVEYPPFTRFIVVDVSSMESRYVDDHARILTALIPEASEYHQRTDVLTPTVSKIRNHYRRMIIIRNFKHTDPSGKWCRALLRSVMDSYYTRYAHRDVRVRIDIDANGLI